MHPYQKAIYLYNIFHSSAYQARPALLGLTILRDAERHLAIRNRSTRPCITADMSKDPFTAVLRSNETKALGVVPRSE